METDELPDLDECATEPIHIPGSIQSHGILFVLSNEKKLRVLQVSLNVERLTGLRSDRLLGRSLLDFVRPQARDAVAQLVRRAASSFVNPFRVPLSHEGTETHFEGIAHVLDTTRTILELEPVAESPQTSPSDGIDSYLHLVENSLRRLGPDTEIADLAGMMCREVRRFTGFDRVMIYRFAHDQHGEVIAEERAEGMEPYLGLHYPASDIPAQARELYLRNPVRLLPDVDAGQAGIAAASDDPGEPLDLSLAVLRSMSPIHLQYLRNMGVSATLTISLVTGNRLWGLIACHHRTPRFVPYGVRATASLYGVVMAAQILERERTISSQRAATARRTALELITGLPDLSDMHASLSRSLARFSSLFDADGSAVVTASRVDRDGSSPEVRAILALCNELEAVHSGGSYLSDSAPGELPSLRDSLPAGAGLVAIHLGHRAWLLLFRDELVREVAWGGDPRLAKTRGAGGSLGPRKSFEAWRETVRGRSIPWDETTSLLTTEIRSGLVELIAQRNHLLEKSNEELRRFAGIIAHEVKSQLQAGLMALSLMRTHLGQTIDPDIAQISQMGENGLSNLGGFVSEMLSFARAQSEGDTEEFELSPLVEEAVAQIRANHPIGDTTIEIGELPRISSQRSAMRHLITNLITNAILHARDPDRNLRIEIGSRTSTGAREVYVRDNGRGIPADEHEKIFRYFYRQSSSQAPGSGIGLGFCSQLVAREGHRLWVDSQPGEGAAFVFTVTEVEATPNESPRSRD